jgi:hypothetical protein
VTERSLAAKAETGARNAEALAGTASPALQVNASADKGRDQEPSADMSREAISISRELGARDLTFRSALSAGDFDWREGVVDQRVGL